MSGETLKFAATPAGWLGYHSAPRRGRQPTALLWPSLFSSGHATWELQLAPLHALGLHTIVVDPPGQGRSGPPPPRFSIRQCSDAALQILDEEGISQAAFLGVSWGSFVALQAAIHAPERVTSLVLSNPSAYRMPATARIRDRLLCRLIRLGFPERFALPGSLGRMVVPNLLGPRAIRDDAAFVSRLIEEIDALDRTALADAARAVLVEREDLGRHLGGIRAPALIVAGEVDRALPAAQHAAPLAASLPGARYELLPQVAHLAPREAPEAFASLLRAFLGDGLAPCRS